MKKTLRKRCSKPLYVCEGGVRRKGFDLEAKPHRIKKKQKTKKKTKKKTKNKQTNKKTFGITPPLPSGLTCPIITLS